MEGEEFGTQRNIPVSYTHLVSNTSGAAGIAYWINAWYKLPEERRVDKSSPLVTKMKEWVDKEYEDGRVTVLTDEELVAKIDSVCKELHITL